MPHVQHDYFFPHSTNQIINLWRRRHCCRCRFLSCQANFPNDDAGDEGDGCAYVPNDDDDCGCSGNDVDDDDDDVIGSSDDDNDKLNERMMNVGFFS